jgi:hypothetical protein
VCAFVCLIARVCDLRSTWVFIVVFIVVVIGVRYCALFALIDTLTSVIQIFHNKNVEEETRRKGNSMDKRIVRGAIVTKFGSQCVAAKALGIHERRLSRLLNGHDEMKPEERKIFLERLGVKIEEAREDAR